MFSQILVEFLFRFTFGVAAAMGLTASRQVTSGFFRVHLWVLLGVQTLAALATYSWPMHAKTPAAAISMWQFSLAVAGAVAAYAGAVIWMYERLRPGKTLIWLVAILALLGCTIPLLVSPTANHQLLWLADRFSGGALLGLVTTAMLLGHWYLNTPTMQLAPLRRLIGLLAGAVLLRMVVCGSGLALELTLGQAQDPHLASWLLFVALRWLAGLVGVLGLAWLTRETLKIPNTQSATGILYAAVILAFIGELSSQLLSAEATYPI